MKRNSLPFMSRMPGSLVKAVATLCGLGNIGPAPGTLGSLAGTIFFALFIQGASEQVSFIIIVALLIVGVFFCDEAELRMGRTDPGSVIMDEFAAMPIVFLGLATPVSLYWWIGQLLLGFLLFRLFDILKPFGISKIQDLPGGLGIMADDIAAALVSCIILHVCAKMILLFA